MSSKEKYFLYRKRGQGQATPERYTYRLIFPFSLPLHQHRVTFFLFVGGYSVIAEIFLYDSFQIHRKNCGEEFFERDECPGICLKTLPRFISYLVQGS
jgi:hypothetical protein